jgi:hypothetical protein
VQSTRPVGRKALDPVFLVVPNRTDGGRNRIWQFLAWALAVFPTGLTAVATGFGNFWPGIGSVGHFLANILNFLDSSSEVWKKLIPD